MDRLRWLTLDAPSRPSEIANTGSIARLLRPGSEALCREADWHSLIAAAVEKKAQPDVVDQLAAALRMASDPAHGVLLLSVTCRLVLQTLAAGGDSTQALTVLPEPLDRFLLGRRVSGSPAASLEAIVTALSGAGLAKRQVNRPAVVALSAHLLRLNSVHSLLHAVARSAPLHEAVAQAVADAISSSEGGHRLSPGVTSLISLVVQNVAASAAAAGAAAGPLTNAMLQFLGEVQKRAPALAAASLASGVVTEALASAVASIRPPAAAKSALRLGHDFVFQTLQVPFGLRC